MKRILSIVLCLSLLCTALLVPVAAAESNTVELDGKTYDPELLTLITNR